jgi:hypothetical protein
MRQNINCTRHSFAPVTAHPAQGLVNCLLDRLGTKLCLSRVEHLIVYVNQMLAHVVCIHDGPNVYTRTSG